MPEIAFYRDRFVAINQPVVPIEERGHQFGDGVYEVVRVYGGRPFLVDDHLRRLATSAAAISLTLPLPLARVAEIISEAVALAGLAEAEVYFQLTRGIAPRQHTFPAVPALFSLTVRPARAVADPRKGIAVVTVEDDRWLNCWIKSLNLLANVLAKQKAAAQGCAEAIFVRDGIVTEGASSNLFTVREGALYTHPASRHILRGITREKVLALARQHAIPVTEKEFGVEFLLQADEAFITGTGSEVMPIASIDGQTMAATRPVSELLIAAYRQLRN